MIPFKKIVLLAVPFAMIAAGCTKLKEELNDSYTNAQIATSLGANGTGLLLNGAYADIAGIFFSQDLLFSLQECTTDEALVPTRGGDWDDNGVWRVLHNHTWTADHGQILSVFNALNKLNFDATNVLNFNPTASQKAEARFLRALALYHLLDLYGQYPFREPGEDLRKAPVVKSGLDGINFIIAELTAALPDIPTGNGNTLANQDAVKFLLMRCYLNKGAYANRTAPTFDAADMNQVITLGNQILASPKYALNANYFDNFSVDNDTRSKEGIFTYPNTSGVNVNHGSIEARWNMTLHYNSYTPANPNAGWNGFSTISEFYSSFNTTPTATAFGPNDTLLDKRLGGRWYNGSTNISGIRPGFLVGQQFNENGVALKDRTAPPNALPLAYTPTIASNMIETGANKEITGIRVVKYVPDYAYYGGPAGNDLMMFRFADALLMVAEAQIRSGGAGIAAGLALVNQLRATRGAAPFTTLPLVNTSNVDDPHTFLAERGRELYWESVRRTDLIRFGVFSKPWGLKPVDDVKYILFPVPNQALAANPNLKQNAGY
jgi:hypothetical protein